MYALREQIGGCFVCPKLVFIISIVTYLVAMVIKMGSIGTGSIQIVSQKT